MTYQLKKSSVCKKCERRAGSCGAARAKMAVVNPVFQYISTVRLPSK